MKEMARDVSPFLFNPHDAKRIEKFEPYLRQTAR